MIYRPPTLDIEQPHSPIHLHPIEFSKPVPSSGRPSYQEALDFLFDRINYERLSDGHQRYEFRLQKTRELIRKLGLARYLFPGGDEGSNADGPSGGDQEDLKLAKSNPEVPLVHIAGTKGKGSTATMVSEILTAAGYRVGLYTSPHLTDLEERFRIDGRICSRDELVELVEIIRPVVSELDQAGHCCSFFELTTAIALLHFDRAGCDVIVMEVGLGGRLDSTNVCASSVAAITSIGLDHQRVLGDTLPAIAGEKAGIIKSDAPVVCGPLGEDAAEVIRRRASDQGAPIYAYGQAFSARDYELLVAGCQFSATLQHPDLVRGNRPDELVVRLPIDGLHQCHNASVAISITRLLSDVLPVSDQQILAGLAKVQLMGRVEYFSLPGGARVILDTAHNDDSIEALATSLSSRLSGKSVSTHRLGRPVIAVFACSRDKDPVGMLERLSPMVDHVVGTQFTTNPRRMPLDQLHQSLDRLSLRSYEIIEDPVASLEQAIAKAGAEGTIVICGSFFLAGQLRELLVNRCHSVSGALADASVDAARAGSAVEASR